MSASVMTEEQIYTVSEVASILRVHPRTIRKMIKAKEIEAFMIRDEYRIRQSAVNKVIHKGATEEK